MWFGEKGNLNLSFIGPFEVLDIVKLVVQVSLATQLF